MVCLLEHSVCIHLIWMTFHFKLTKLDFFCFFFFKSLTLLRKLFSKRALFSVSKTHFRVQNLFGELIKQELTNWNKLSLNMKIVHVCLAVLTAACSTLDYLNVAFNSVKIFASPFVYRFGYFIAQRSTVFNITTAKYFFLSNEE